MLIGTLGVVVVLFIGLFYRHQVLLRDRAHLMREAIRNQEFTFSLPLTMLHGILHLFKRSSTLFAIPSQTAL